MREEILQKLHSLESNEVKDKLLNMTLKGTLRELKNIKEILGFIEDTNVLVGDVSVRKGYLIKVLNSSIFSKAFDIVDIASKHHPISTTDVILRAGLKNATRKTKLEVGHLLALAGFKRISVHRAGLTPAKVWRPMNKSIDDQYRAEYFFTLLKEHDRLTDTQALDDLI